jgi:gliding motility-associated-like protein
VTAKEGYTYTWIAEGGSIVKGQGSPSIEVNWAKSRPDGYVQVMAVNASGCASKTLLNVRINPELQTEIPEGATQVCLNDRNAQVYKVTRTNGSVYTWGVKGGAIMSGQGTHQVSVSWNGAGTHQLWLQEQSVTVDTVCYGASDTLAVSVSKDESSIVLHYVSISNNTSADIRGQLLTNLKSVDSVFVYRRRSEQNEWSRVAGIKTDGKAISYTDTGLNADETTYQYRLATTNFCREPIESALHQTIKLLAEVQEPQSEQLVKQILLTWSPYKGWENNVDRYELWRRLDEKEYTIVATLPDGSLDYTVPSTTDGFVHYYRVKAIASFTKYESWSNETKLEFVHNLDIPNVFTPNGDGINDRFEIKNIHLYQENELVIYNRWGKEIFRKQRYDGSWQAENLPNGIYYYEFSTRQLNQYYKGMLQVLR